MRPDPIRAGARFDRLTVVAAAPPDEHSARWECVCECGERRFVRPSALRSGRTRSCGCYTRQRARARLIRHGAAHLPGYNTWKGIVGRCHDPNNKYFDRYGGRGITVCDRWRESVQAFLDDMGAPPAKGYSLDRIDNDGNYEPANCRWATAREQNRNQRTNRYVTAFGERLLLCEWAERNGIPSTRIWTRITELGWTPEDAVSVTERCRARGRRFIEALGQRLTLAEWARRTGLVRETITNRIDVCGWDEERALTTPALWSSRGRT